jgi:multiple sugar transport system permease protein
MTADIITARNRVSKPTRSTVGSAVRVLILGAVALLTLLPLAYALFASFKPIADLLTNGAKLIPSHWTWVNYAHVWSQADVARLVGNSLFVAATVIILDLITSPLVGYLLARKLLPLGRVTTGLLAGTLFIGVGTATLYPRYLIANWLGIGNLVGVALVELSGLTTVHAFLVRAYAQSIPIEIEDAARLDGCGLLASYRRVVFPLLRPIIATTVVLAFQAAWNNFQVAYVFTLGSPDMRTVVVGVYSLRESSNGAQAFDLMLAGAAIVITPIIVLFAALQRLFIRGLTDGAIK